MKNTATHDLARSLRLNHDSFGSASTGLGNKPTLAPLTLISILAAILAMIPLTRSVFFGPMAVAIMGGLTVATALTLLFLPAAYAAWFRITKPVAA